MPDEDQQRQPPGQETAGESTRGRHPTEEGDPGAPPAVPEDEEIVPNRHSASAEAAWMRWREDHGQE